MKKYFLVEECETIEKALSEYDDLPDTIEEAERWRDATSTLYVIQPHKESENGNEIETMCKS